MSAEGGDFETDTGQKTHENNMGGDIGVLVDGNCG